MGFWGFLKRLFGDEPPPRPVSRPHPQGRRSGPHRHHGHHEEADEARRQAEEQVADAADDPPAPHHDPGHHP